MTTKIVDIDERTPALLAVGAERLLCKGVITGTGRINPACIPSGRFPDWREGSRIGGLFSCRIGRTPLCGGQLRPGAREAGWTRSRGVWSHHAST